MSRPSPFIRWDLSSIRQHAGSCKPSRTTGGSYLDAAGRDRAAGQAQVHAKRPQEDRGRASAETAAGEAADDVHELACVARVVLNAETGQQVEVFDGSHRVLTLSAAPTG